MLRGHHDAGDGETIPGRLRLLSSTTTPLTVFVEREPPNRMKPASASVTSTGIRDVVALIELSSLLCHADECSSDSCAE